MSPFYTRLFGPHFLNVVYQFRRCCTAHIVTSAQTHRQTDRPRYSVCGISPHLSLRAAVRAKKTGTSGNNQVVIWKILVAKWCDTNVQSVFNDPSSAITKYFDCRVCMHVCIFSHDRHVWRENHVGFSLIMSNSSNSVNHYKCDANVTPWNNSIQFQHLDCLLSSVYSVIILYFLHYYEVFHDILHL